MNKEILLYGAIYSYTTSDIIAKLDEAKDSDITLRINTPGGDPLYNYGIIAKFSEHPKRKIAKVDGQASSAGAFFCCYADYVECLDVSEFLFHRAAYPDYIESSLDYFTEDLRKALANTNKNLRAAMEGKFTSAKWKAVTGVSLDDLFSLETRIDVILNAEQAKELGLVDKINVITPEKKAEIESLVMGMAAFNVPKLSAATQEVSKIPINMTIEKLKADHPEVYAAAVTAGVNQERDRAGAYLAFVDVDPEAVANGIKGGQPLSLTAQAEFFRKTLSQQALGAIAADSAGTVQTSEAKVGQESKDAKLQASTDAFMAAVKVDLGLK